MPAERKIDLLHYSGPMTVVGYPDMEAIRHLEEEKHKAVTHKPKHKTSIKKSPPA